MSRPVIHAPMPPQKPRTKGPRKKPTPVQKTWDGVPSEVFSQLFSTFISSVTETKI